jgi:hypothetical protein
LKSARRSSRATDVAQPMMQLARRARNIKAMKKRR